MRYHTMIRAAHEVEGAGGRRARGQRGQREHQEGEAWASSSSGRGRCSNGRAASVERHGKQQRRYQKGVGGVWAAVKRGMLEWESGWGLACVCVGGWRLGIFVGESCWGLEAGEAQPTGCCGRKENISVM